MSVFVFFHVGADVSQPAMLAHSIRATNPAAQIIQCTDKSTPVVPNVNEVHRTTGDPDKLMIYRLQGFAALGLKEPALYLDTDMLVLRQISPIELLGQHEAILCKRSFNLQGPFIGRQRGLDFSEYHNKPLGEVYPFVACTTISRSQDFWEELSEILIRLDRKFLEWYGDQEAMKAWGRSHSIDSYGTLPESEYGCLPEERQMLKNAKILHFKGHQRKAAMTKFYNAIFNLDSSIPKKKSDDLPRMEK